MMVESTSIGVARLIESGFESAVINAIFILCIYIY